MKSILVSSLLWNILVSSSLALDPSEFVNPKDDPLFVVNLEGDITGEDQVCNGIVLNEKFILTAASCSGGTFIFINANTDKFERNFKKEIFYHPGFNYSTMNDNLAIIQVNDKIEYPTSARLPKQGEQPTNDPSCVYSYDGNDLTECPKLSLLSSNECKAAFGDKTSYSLDNKICSKSATLTTKDDGSALVQNGVVIGLGTRIFWNSKPNVALFNPLNLYRDWIDETLNANK